MCARLFTKLSYVWKIIRRLTKIAETSDDYLKSSEDWKFWKFRRLLTLSSFYITVCLFSFCRWIRAQKENETLDGGKRRGRYEDVAVWWVRWGPCRFFKILVLSIFPYVGLVQLRVRWAAIFNKSTKLQIPLTIYCVTLDQYWTDHSFRNGTTVGQTWHDQRSKLESRRRQLFRACWPSSVRRS